MNQFVGQQQVEAEGEAFHTGSPFGCSVVWNRTNGSCKQEGNEEQRVIGNEEEHRRSDLQYGPEDSMKEKTKGEMEDDDLKTPKRRGEEVSWIQKVCWHQQKIWPFQRTTSASADGARAVLIMFLVLIVALAIQFGVWVLVFAPFTASSGWKKPAVVGSAIIDLNYTTYEGLRLSNGVNAFLGMRYAAPPLGNLRWRAPVEPERVTGRVVPASKFPPICLGIGAGYPHPGQDEDCLFVNVWMPANATRSSKLPVWVFIQGGGYVTNSNANWDGAEVVEKSKHSIVMVNFNYRVGLWGFLASERVRADGDLNVGLLDQRMLLKWVRTYINEFGGDPNHVVIHGASAGAGSVAMHLVAYGGRDDALFIGGMAESLFFPSQPFVSELEYQFDRLVSQTGCAHEPPDHQMACLRGKDVAILQAANVAQPFPGRSQPPMPLFYWTPCVDGDFLQDLPYRMFAKGQFIRVPMVFGTSTDEGTVFAINAATKDDVAMFLANNYPRLTPNDTDTILALYPKRPPVPRHNDWFPTASQAYGEATFICPQTNVLNYLLSSSYNNTDEAGLKFFAYRYNVRDDENMALGLGVPHIFDAPAIFGPDNVDGGRVRVSYRTYNAGVVPLMMSYYISFVRALDVNVYRMKGSASWETWDSTKSTTEGARWGRRLVFESPGKARMEEVPPDERKRCEYWLGLGEKMRQKK